MYNFNSTNCELVKTSPGEIVRPTRKTIGQYKLTYFFEKISVEFKAFCVSVGSARPVANGTSIIMQKQQAKLSWNPKSPEYPAGCYCPPVFSREPHFTWSLRTFRPLTLRLGNYLLVLAQNLAFRNVVYFLVDWQRNEERVLKFKWSFVVEIVFKRN